MDKSESPMAIEDIRVANLINAVRVVEPGIRTEEGVSVICKNISESMEEIGLDPAACIPTGQSFLQFLLSIFNGGGNMADTLENIFRNKKREDVFTAIYPKKDLSLKDMQDIAAREREAGNFKAACAWQERIIAQMAQG